MPGSQNRNGTRPILLTIAMYRGTASRQYWPSGGLRFFTQNQSSQRRLALTCPCMRIEQSFTGVRWGNNLVKIKWAVTTAAPLSRCRRAKKNSVLVFRCFSTVGWRTLEIPSFRWERSFAYNSELGRNHWVPFDVIRAASRPVIIRTLCRHSFCGNGTKTIKRW
jgi:hypothetical protein